MTRLVLLLPALALLAQAPPPSGSPADLYHAGARAFIDGDDAAALRAVDAGLALAPDDAKLRALRDLIEPPDQDQQDDGGEGDEPQDADEQDEGEGQESPETPSDDGQEAERDQTQTDPGEAQAGEAPSRPDGREPQPMTRAQAERILDAVGTEEELLLRELRRAPTQRSRSEKDW